MSSTGTGFGPLSSRERGNLAVGLACCRFPALWIPAYARMTAALPCHTSGLRTKSAMTVRGGCVGLLSCLVRPRPVVSRLRGNDGPGDYGGFAVLCFLFWMDDVEGLFGFCAS